MALVAHNTLSVKQFLDQKSYNEVQYPFYPSDLAPNDLLLFQKIKSALKGKGLQDIEDIQIK
jgi:hypothetical protein